MKTTTSVVQIDLVGAQIWRGKLCHDTTERMTIQSAGRGAPERGGSCPLFDTLLPVSYAQHHSLAHFPMDSTCAGAVPLDSQCGGTTAEYRIHCTLPGGMINRQDGFSIVHYGNVVLVTRGAIPQEGLRVCDRKLSQNSADIRQHVLVQAHTQQPHRYTRYLTYSLRTRLTCSKLTLAHT